MPKIKAILFDLDNTLIDFVKMKEESCKSAVHAMVAAGLKIPEAEAYERLMKTYFDVGIESDTAFSAFLKSEGQFSHKILAAAINTYLKTKNKFLKPYPNVKPTLKTLKQQGITLSIVTDAPKTKAYQRLMGMGIEPYFKIVVGHEDTGKAKATGLPLKLALRMLKQEHPDLESSEILMVGDSMRRDLIPAKKLGLRTALSKYGQKENETEAPNYELNNFEDLQKIVL